MAIFKAINSKAVYIKSVVDYVKKDAKTSNGYYVEGINCNPQRATTEFMQVQQLWDKTNGRRYFHYVISWNSKENITHEQTLEITKECIKRNPKLDGYQILIASHTDQKNGNKHVHIIGNSVNMVTGKKMNSSAKDLANWKKICNDVNLEYGFQPPRKKTIAEKRKNPSTWSKDEYHAQQKAIKKNKKGLKEFILEAIIDAYTMVTSKQEFISALNKNGITVTWNDSRKNITYTAASYDADTNKKALRDSNIEKTFGFKCDKDTLEAKFKENFEQNQVKEQEVLNEQREREAVGLKRRYAAILERRRSDNSSRRTARRDRCTEGAIRPSEPSTDAFIREITANEESAAAERANRDAERERLAAQKANDRKQKSKVEQRSIAERTETKRTRVAKRTTSKRSSSQEYGRN